MQNKVSKTLATKNLKREDLAFCPNPHFEIPGKS